MRVKNKKSLFAIIVISLLTIGVTYAVFSTTSVYENLFNVIDYNVVTQEVFTSPDDWAPGDTVSRSITAKNEGSVLAAVRIKYVIVWKDENDVEINNVSNDSVILNFTSPNNWTKVGDYYYYNYALGVNETTSSLITGVTLNPNLDTPSCTLENGVESCVSNVQGLYGEKCYITFTIETVQYDKYQDIWDTDYVIGQRNSVVVLPTGRTSETLEVGDLVCIDGSTEECFNFIGYNGNNAVLLAKYNLNVGSNAKGSETFLQDSEVLGDYAGLTTYGTVAFSNINYWNDNGNIKSKYGAWNTNNIYDTDYVGASGEYYSIAYYVEQYKNILTNYGAVIEDARLLTYSDAVGANIGCSGSSCPTNSFITNTSFWLGSASDEDDVWLIASDGEFINNYNYDVTSYFGVRPVVVISKDSF